jgi:hypothetical protein
LAGVERVRTRRRSGSPQASVSRMRYGFFMPNPFSRPMPRCVEARTRSAHWRFSVRIRGSSDLPPTSSSTAHQSLQSVFVLYAGYRYWTSAEVG